MEANNSAIEMILNDLGESKGTSNDNSFATIEKYISEKFDDIALFHLKQKIVNEIKTELKIDQKHSIYNDAIYKNHIEFLSSEIIFLREELREKSLIIKSLMNQIDISKCNNDKLSFSYNIKLNNNPLNPFDNKKNLAKIHLFRLNP